MTRTSRARVVTTALSVLAVSAFVPARADAPETNGLICQFASVVDPTAEAGTQTGQLSGGPVLLFEQSADPTLPGTTPEAGTLTCKVTVASTLTSDHTLDGQKVQGHSDTGVFTAGPATINYVAPPGTNVFLCSEFTDDSDGVTYYWDDDNGEWSTSALVHCGLAVGAGGGDRHPHGEVDLWGFLGQFSYTVSGPWNCIAGATSVTCTADVGNATCTHLTAQTDQLDTPATSACASPPYAVDPGDPSTDTISKDPWTCSAAPAVAVLFWHVYCTVN